MLTVITPAPTHDLTSLSTVKAELGVTDRAEDGKLLGYIEQASDVIANHCNRTFALETVTETIRNSGGSCFLLLERYPIVSVASVTENGTPIDPDDYEINGDDGTIMRLCGGRPVRWATGKIVVTYSAGYELPAGLPTSIERACILLVKMYAAAGDRDPMVRSEAVDGAGSTDYFSGAGTGLPPEVQGLLDPHLKPNG